MLGWKPVVRTLDGVSFEQAKDALLRQGFVEFDVGEYYAVSKKSGTSLTMNADKVALEVALAGRATLSSSRCATTRSCSSTPATLRRRLTESRGPSAGDAWAVTRPLVAC